jgi:hypothetical protein
MGSDRSKEKVNENQPGRFRVFSSPLLEQGASGPVRTHPRDKEVTMRLMKILLVALCGMVPLSAEDVPAPTMAKFLGVLAKMAGHPNQVACRNLEVRQELKKLGIKVDDASVVAYAVSEAEVTELYKAKKLVVCPRLEWLPKGASIAILPEEEKPSIYLHLRHVEAAGVQFSKNLFRFSYVVSKGK